MIKNLWFIPLLLLTAIAYERGVKEISTQMEGLQHTKEEIDSQKKLALVRKESLERQIMSQSDPRWITLTLTRVLGVVPEGQTKVYFKSK